MTIYPDLTQRLIAQKYRIMKQVLSPKRYIEWLAFNKKTNNVKETQLKLFI